MALAPNTPFSEGDAWTPDLAYQAFNSPVFDDQPQYLGHRQKIQDNELSDAAGQIKDRVGFIETSLKVTIEAGLTIRYSSGVVTLPNNSTLAIVSGLLGVTNNATTFIFIDIAGQPRADSRLPAIGIPLARVTAVNGTISQVQDLRHPNQKAVSPAPYAIKVFGGSSTVDFIGTNGFVLDRGYHYFRDFTVPVGVTITVSRFARIFCAGNVNIAGTINVTALASGAPTTAFNLAPNGAIGNVRGSGLGNNNVPYPWAASPNGSGGSLGLIQCASGTAWGYMGFAGDGGGGIWIEAAGIITVSGTIRADGTLGDEGGNYPNMALGGYTNTSNLCISGSGGGSGGLIFLSSLLSITAASGSTLSVKGSVGGTGVGAHNTAPAAGVRMVGIGGGGGGGGYVVLSSPANNVSGATINISGGQSGVCRVFATGTVAAPTFFTEPSPGVYRAQDPTMVLAGGLGGSYAGASVSATVTYATENSVPVQYITRQNAQPGQLLLQNFTPIGQ